MTVQMIIELNDRQAMQTVVQALEAYKTRLRISIQRAQERLSEFERRYGV